jgi:hypothetical protein
MIPGMIRREIGRKMLLNEYRLRTDPTNE